MTDLFPYNCCFWMSQMFYVSCNLTKLSQWLFWARFLSILQGWGYSFNFLTKEDDCLEGFVIFAGDAVSLSSVKCESNNGCMRCKLRKFLSHFLGSKIVNLSCFNFQLRPITISRRCLYQLQYRKVATAHQW